ncbi:armadillo-type protein [Mycena vulgaris]|nr:armadillo-type protein [Mycena vulgaris]
MPPLSRQRTPESIYSWWSDSNPPGATISLHAAAKPLMKFMHDRQASGFIERSRQTPLSQTTMQIYASYLAFKYVSSSTKAAILIELEKRVVFEQEACVVVDSLAADCVAELLESPDTKVRALTWKVLGELAHHEATAAEVLRLNPCVQVLSLSAKDFDVLEDAIHALSLITRSAAGAQSAMDANMLHWLPRLLESPNAQVRRWTCRTLAHLANQSTRVVARTESLCTQLVSLLSDSSDFVIESAIFALSVITESPDGAAAAVDAKMLDCVVGLLESPNHRVHRWTCLTVGDMAHHDPRTVAVLGARICAPLVSLLSGRDPRIIESATYALSWITQSRDGAQAAVDANMLNWIGDLLQTPNSRVRRWKYRILGHLAFHESTEMTTPGLNPHMRRVSLFRDADIEAIEGAIYALSWITQWPSGARSAVETNTLDGLSELLESPKPHVRRWTGTILDHLVLHHESRAAVAVVGMQLVLLLRHSDGAVRESAGFALAKIASGLLQARESASEEPGLSEVTVCMM